MMYLIAEFFALSFLSWLGPGVELYQFLRIFLLTSTYFWYSIQKTHSAFSAPNIFNQYHGRQNLFAAINMILLQLFSLNGLNVKCKRFNFNNTSVVCICTLTAIK